MNASPRTVSRVLAATAVALLLAFVLFHAWVPWWTEALLLAAAAIASMEAVAAARGESR